MPKGKKPVVDSSDGDEIDDGPLTNQSLVSALATNPALMEAVQSRLNGLVGKTSGYIENLPASVKRRVNALKNLQLEYANIEGKFYEEVHALEMKYAELFKPVYEKRNLIVNGDYEPNDTEATWVEPGVDEEDEEKEEGEEKEEEKKRDEESKGEDSQSKVKENENEADKLAEELNAKASLGDGDKDEDTKGINEFWLTAMKNVEMLSDMIQPHDEPILQHLSNIKLIFNGKGQEEPEDSDVELGFALEFHFTPNDFFTNTVLTKSYKIQCHPDKDDPFAFEGTEITGCTGCNIDWKRGKNVTLKTIKKKQKHKGRGQTRMVAKTIKNDSFFNFFAPPEVDEDGEVDEDTEALLTADFELGHFFRERLIPKAVLYFTGEAIDDEDEDYEDSEGDEGDDEELDEDEDPDFEPPADGGKPPECKQQ